MHRESHHILGSSVENPLYNSNSILQPTQRSFNRFNLRLLNNAQMWEQSIQINRMGWIKSLKITKISYALLYLGVCVSGCGKSCALRLSSCVCRQWFYLLNRCMFVYLCVSLQRTCVSGNYVSFLVCFSFIWSLSLVYGLARSRANIALMPFWHK